MCLAFLGRGHVSYKEVDSRALGGGFRSSRAGGVRNRVGAVLLVSGRSFLTVRLVDGGLVAWGGLSGIKFKKSLFLDRTVLRHPV